MQGMWSEHFRIQVHRHVDLQEAEHDPSEVLQVMHDLSIGKVLREDDRRPDRSGREKCHAHTWGDTGWKHGKSVHPSLSRGLS